MRLLPRDPAVVPGSGRGTVAARGSADAAAEAGTSGTPGTLGTLGTPTLPARWPSGWPSLWPAIARRVMFVAAVEVLTAAGLLLVADPVTQGWVLPLPLLLLVGPLSAPSRVRRRAQRAADAGCLVVDAAGVVSLRRGPLPRRAVARLDRTGAVRYLR